VETRQQARRLAQRALELGPDEREAFLVESCGDDMTLYAAVEAEIARSRVREIVTEFPLLPTVSVVPRDGGEPITLAPSRSPTDPLPHAYFTEGAPVELVEEEEIPLAIDAEDARYDLGTELGRGGMGVVLAAMDRRMRRTVAIKMLKQDVRADRAYRRRFVHEAQITCQLEHPSIIPIHDLGILGDDALFYTMRVVRSPSLSDVLYDAELRREWSLVRLLGVFVQVCRAVGYAHARRIVHRDLKPSNILLGDYGEVYVADWGLAKVLGQDDAGGDAGADESAARAPSTASPGTHTLAGVGLGTPGYMAPEQALGRWEEVDHRADLFALGVVLFEILTGRQPFRGDTSEDLVTNTIESEPPRPRRLVASCPLMLEDLCLALLDKRADRRPASAVDVALEVEAFLEGSRERERRHAEAEHLVLLAEAAVVRAHELGADRDRFRAEAIALLRDVPPWGSIDRKLVGWELEDRARRADIAQARTLAEAIELYSQALGYDKENRTARAGLADLYWERAQTAEARRNEAGRIYNELRLQEYDDGRYTSRLSADSELDVQSDPPGAEVAAYRYVEQNRVLVAGRETHLGRTPVRGARLEPGSYLLIARREGYRDVRSTVLCRRGERHERSFSLYREDEIGPAFVYVPAGRCAIGGEGPNALARVEVDVPGFAISRFPVTYAQYLAFVNDLDKRDPELALRRAPRPNIAAGTCVRRDGSGAWVPAWDAIVEGAAQVFAPAHRAGQLPVESVSWFDAVAYCRWLSERHGAAYRVPTEVEWEKSARGADGRMYPWGDGFDPSFCKMRDSRPGRPQPEPVGAFATDKSPYGVRDLAGGVRSWVADVFGQLSAEEALREPEPPPTASRSLASFRAVRGASWSSSAVACQAVSRELEFATTRASDVGFRIAKTLPRG
jgi:formylglycine-generating enzyme required for sulfatase activity/serine/threonine protein kinase